MSVAITSLLKLNAQQFLSTVTDPHVTISYSQFGEDIVVDFIAGTYCKPAIERGFYVDLGAFHPKQYSNTQLLRWRGWRGINVDANSDVITLFQKQCPNDINVCCGISDRVGEQAYYVFDGTGADNTFDSEAAKRMMASGRAKLRETRRVPCLPVNAILDEHLPTGTRIDFLNVDIEGYDLQALGTLDFERYRPVIVAVETGLADHMAISDNPSCRLLAEHGYSLVSINVHTAIFVDKQAI